jgi:hypothetical protein
MKENSRGGKLKNIWPKKVKMRSLKYRESESQVNRNLSPAPNSISQWFHAALQRCDHSLRIPTSCYYEHYLNLIRLSSLSMSTYALRTLPPSACAACSRLASPWAQTLIHNVLLRHISLPSSDAVNTVVRPDLRTISRRIMQ